MNKPEYAGSTPAPAFDISGRSAPGKSLEGPAYALAVVMTANTRSPQVKARADS